MGKSPGSFVFNVDQKTVREPWKKPLVLLATALLAAGALGGAAVYAKQREEAGVKTEDEKLSQTELSGSGFEQFVQVSTATGSKYAFYQTQKSTPSVKSHDMRRLASSAAPSGIGVAVSQSCSATQNGYWRSEWRVFFPDKLETAAVGVDVCFVYADTVTTTFRLKHAEHGFGAYTLKGSIHAADWKKTNWCVCYDWKDYPYEKEIQVTQEGWRSWFK